MRLCGFIQTRLLPIDLLSRFDSFSLEFDWSAPLWLGTLGGIEIQQATVKHSVCVSIHMPCRVYSYVTVRWFVQTRLCPCCLLPVWADAGGYICVSVSVWVCVCVCLFLQPTAKIQQPPIIYPQDTWVCVVREHRKEMEKCKTLSWQHVIATVLHIQ